MHITSLLTTSLALLTSVVAAPAASGSYGLQVKYQNGTGKFDNHFLSFNTYQNTRIVALANGLTKPTGGSPYTITSGAIHVQVPPNMVISSGEYSTNTFTFGEFVIFDQGSGSNANVVIDKNSRLSFKAKQGNSCTFECWNICPLESSAALALGAVKQNGCHPVIVKAVKLQN